MNPMASDRTVTARDVLRALLNVRREGTGRLLEDLERREPDLAEYLLEELTAVHGLMAAAGVPPRDARRVYRRVEAGALVLLAAVGAAHARLWREDAAGTLLAAIDPTLTDSPQPDGGRGCGG
jgi:hypothetical protein